MVCAVQTGGKRNRPTANPSMILTARCRNRRATSCFEPFRPAPRRRKLLITGTASHLNHVPDTTCHIGGLIEPAGMRVAYITGKRGAVALGKEASKADSNKAWVWNEAGLPVGYHVVPDKNKNTPPHKQATDTPRQAGFFLPMRAGAACWRCGPRRRVARSRRRRPLPATTGARESAPARTMLGLLFEICGEGVGHVLAVLSPAPF
jgi:hypothetical protein